MLKKGLIIVLKFLGLNQKTSTYNIHMQLTEKGWVIISPFYPGKGPWCYGIRKPIGYIEDCCSIEIVDREHPYGHSFKDMGHIAVDQVVSMPWDEPSEKSSVANPPQTPRRDSANPQN
jgi:hypothetical protein